MNDEPTDDLTLGETAARMLDKIDRVYGEEAMICDAIVIAEVGYTDDEGERCSAIEWYCTSPRSVIRRGLIDTAHKADETVAQGDDDEGDG